MCPHRGPLAREPHAPPPHLALQLRDDDRGPGEVHGSPAAPPCGGPQGASSAWGPLTGAPGPRGQPAPTAAPGPGGHAAPQPARRGAWRLTGEAAAAPSGNEAGEGSQLTQRPAEAALHGRGVLVDVAPVEAEAGLQPQAVPGRQPCQLHLGVSQQGCCQTDGPHRWHRDLRGTPADSRRAVGPSPLPPCPHHRPAPHSWPTSTPSSPV